MKNVAAGQCILTTVKFVAAVQTVIVVITAVLELNAFPAAARKLVSRTRCRTWRCRRQIIYMYSTVR